MVQEAMTKPARKSRTPTKFLLVDDLDMNLLALEAVLRRDDVQLFKATSGPEALELLLVHDFALAILDVQMPEMDGFELAELMRGNERTRRIPIIFVTAGGRDAERRFQGYEAGAVDFLFKPLDARILQHKVEVFVELYQQRAEMAETLRLNEELVAIVTHDLRSPLASILMVADVLAKQTKDEYSLKQADRIRNTCRQLISTVNELLDLSRARLAGGIPVERRDVDLTSVAQRVVRDMSTANPTRTIELIFRGASPRGYWDAERIEQVLMNLIGNAIAHGNVESPIELVISDEGTEVGLTVRNGGVIPEDALPRLFEPFKSGHGRKKSSGLGLGLYIVEQIVLSHGGTVAVETAAQHTTFRVRLPKRSDRSTSGSVS